MISPNPLFLLPVIIGAVFIIAGFIMLKFPPKKINSIYGYRTGGSMKSQERWDFAQRYSSKLMMIAGAFLVLMGCCLINLIVSEMMGAFMGIGLSLIPVAIIIIVTETEMNRRFSKK